MDPLLKNRVAKVVLKSANKVVSSETKTAFSNYVNLGGLQELDGVEKFYVEVMSVSTMSFLPSGALFPSNPDSVKIEILDLPQDGYDAGYKGPPRVVAYLQPTEIGGANATWNSVNSQMYAQGNIPVGGFTIHRDTTNAALWRVQLKWVGSESATCYPSPQLDWEMVLSISY